MQATASKGWSLLMGALLLLPALFFQSITVASESYTAPLILGLALTAAADVYLIEAFRRGGLATRLVSVALLLPTAFVVADFLRRAP